MDAREVPSGEPAASPWMGTRELFLELALKSTPPPLQALAFAVSLTVSGCF